MIILAVPIVLAAIEIRNTSYSWIDSRLEVRSAALKLLDKNFNPNDSQLSEEQRDIYTRAELFLDGQNFDRNSDVDKRLLEKELEDYRKVVIEQVRFVHIPFFGAVFDHNDVAMIAGVTFVIVLLWLKSSSARELDNLKLAFPDTISKGVLKSRYELLAMQQLLSVPRIPGSSNRFRWISKALYIMPLPVYTLQLFFDLNSVFKTGDVLGRGKMWLLIVTSAVLWLLTAALVIWCWKIAEDIDSAWDEAASRVYPGMPPVKPGLVNRALSALRWV